MPPPTSCGGCQGRGAAPHVASFVSTIVDRFHHHYPRMRFQVATASADLLQRDLDDRDLDVLILRKMVSSPKTDCAREVAKPLAKMKRCRHVSFWRHLTDLPTAAHDVCFSMRLVKRFQTIHQHSVAHGLVLLFRAEALPSWDLKTRRNNLWDGLAVSVNGRSKRTYDLTSSIVPRERHDYAHGLVRIGIRPCGNAGNAATPIAQT